MDPQLTNLKGLLGVIMEKVTSRKLIAYITVIVLAYYAQQWDVIEAVTMTYLGVQGAGDLVKNLTKKSAPKETTDNA